jgi:tetratricopeptide (TPR) repeat protein
MPGAREDLVKLAKDPLYPVIVRATALSLLSGYPDEDTTRAHELALMDEEALIRRTAVEALNVPETGLQVKLISPLLYDPVRAVRTNAASKLAGESSGLLDDARKRVFETTLDEFVASMEYSADFAFGRYNLGNLYAAQNRPEDAVREYRAAIGIDGLFYPAKVNLAMLCNRLGQKDEAEALLREVVAEHPQLYEIAYSLGLLLAEKEQYEQAAVYLEKAARGMPGHARVHYNLGVLLDYLGREERAEQALMKALELDPDRLDVLVAAAEFYMKRKRLEQAEKIAYRILSKHPSSPVGRRILDLTSRGREDGVGKQGGR